MVRIFSKSRPDGKLITDGDPLTHIMPYVMRGRNESCVYYHNPVDIDVLQEYIRKKRREGKRITMFNLIITATLHVIYERPHLNRFISGRRLYSRKSFDVLYVVKKSMSDEAEESIARVSFDENDNIFTVTKAMGDIIDSIKNGTADKWDDKLIAYLSKFPRWLLRFVASILRWADFHGLLPESFMKILPMYSSVYVSHLGSIGGGSFFHHLYEFGNTSIFLTIGKVYEAPVKADDGGVEWHRFVDLNFSIDERICDGYYLVKSIKMLNDLLLVPEFLEYSPAMLKRLSKEERRELRKKFKEARNQEGHHHELLISQEDVADRLEIYGSVDTDETADETSDVISDVMSDETSDEGDKSADQA